MFLHTTVTKESNFPDFLFAYWEFEDKAYLKIFSLIYFMVSKISILIKFC